MAADQSDHQENAIVRLNVGGTKFVTSKHTLTSIPDTFFTTLLAGRIASIRDESGAIFIDRDPAAFKVVLNYLRTRQFDVECISPSVLRHEAQFYSVTPLVQLLSLCDELNNSGCGSLLFQGCLSPPPCVTDPSDPYNTVVPTPSPEHPTVRACGPYAQQHSQQFMSLQRPQHLYGHSRNNSAPPSLVKDLMRAPLLAPRPTPHRFDVVSENQNDQQIFSSPPLRPTSSHSRPRLPQQYLHRSNSLDGQQPVTPMPALLALRPSTSHRHVSSSTEPCIRVRAICAHHSWVAVAYSRHVCCYRIKDSLGWQRCFVGSRLPALVLHVALNTKLGGQQQPERLLAAALDNQSIHLWTVNDAGRPVQVGVFTMDVPVDRLFFIGAQMACLNGRRGRVGIWHAATQNWQVQDVLPISSYDTAGTVLLLGCSNGSIYYIDMQKFPLRMKDNDLLITELYRDPQGETITSISMYLTPKTSVCGNWIEIAYGTSSGCVRVIVQHPETVGHGPQLFQTYTVHRSPIVRVMLTTSHLISVCAEYNHVRTWAVTRFRGMISTQPGSKPVAAFKVLSLDEADDRSAGRDYGLLGQPVGNCVGPFGEPDSEQVFVQKVVPDSTKLYIRLASTGERICTISSVDESPVTNFCVHEFDGSARVGSRPSRFLLTGHLNGTVQCWDLTTALEKYNEQTSTGGTRHGVCDGDTTLSPQHGPSADELVKLIGDCEVTTAGSSNRPSPCVSPVL